MLFKIILTSGSVSQILKCDYSNKVSEHYLPVRVFLCSMGRFNLRRFFFIIITFTCQPNFALPPKKGGLSVAIIKCNH